jgi:FkbM family methyltransferase
MGIARVLDVGANIGQFGQHLRGLGYGGDIVSFEPLSDAHAALQAAAAGDARWHVAPRAAIGAESGEIEINVAGNSASSSILAMLDRHRDVAPQSAYVGRETVPLMRLDDAAAAYPGDPARTWLKIDTQGYEAQVMAGAPELLRTVRAVQCEVSFAPLYAGQPLFEAICASMAGHGLAVWAVWPGFVDPASGRLLQADMVFARDI